MIFFIKKQLNKEFVKNAITLMTGTTLAQLLSVLAIPFLSRMYTPESFGLLALFTSIISVVSIISTARYELAIMLPVKDKDASALVLISCMISIIISFLILILMYFNRDFLLEKFGNESSNWIYLLPLTIFLIGLYQSFTYWNNRKKKYKILAATRICQSSITSGSQYWFGVIGAGPGLIIGYILGQFFSTVFIIGLSWNKLIPFLKKSTTAQLLVNLKTYKRFPLYSSFGAILNSLGSQMPVFILMKFFSAESVGFFSLTWRALSLPLNLVTAALTQVLFQRIVEVFQFHPEQLKKYVCKVFGILLILTIPFLVIIWLFGEYLFVIALGESWRESGRYASILVVAIAIRFIVTPLSSVLGLEHNLKLGSFWQSAYFITISLTLYLSRNFEIERFLKIFVLHEIVLHVIFFILILIGSKDLENKLKI